ncbi:hypothetical protein Avbf_06046 [Armadillidium vulgare]|nr:hypothetical protein Avbf_06046 [Armadillidium vulgare]
MVQVLLRMVQKQMWSSTQLVYQHHFSQRNTLSVIIKIIIPIIRILKEGQELGGKVEKEGSEINQMVALHGTKAEIIKLVTHFSEEIRSKKDGIQEGETMDKIQI